MVSFKPTQVATLVCGLALIAGCGGPSAGGGGGANPPMAAPNAPALDHATVTIQDYKFTPSNVVIKQGGTVTWINRDPVTHTATPQSSGGFTGTGPIAANSTSAPVTFATSGTQAYYCEIHPFMKGTITVQ